MGIKVMMLTGDATAVARWVARELALDEFFRCHAQRPIGISGRWRCNRTSWRYVIEVAGEAHLAESHLKRTLFRQIPGRIERLEWHDT